VEKVEICRKHQTIKMNKLEEGKHCRTEAYKLCQISQLDVGKFLHSGNAMQNSVDIVLLKARQRHSVPDCMCVFHKWQVYIGMQ